MLFVRDLPPVTSAGLQVTEPSIYFGELSNDYVIVRTNAREFHYPTRRGRRVDAIFRHAAACRSDRCCGNCCSRCGSPRTDIVLSDDITAESRILFNRRISERVQALAGDFLAFDRDPYLVLVDGRLYWIYDAYTTSGRYPYSTRATGTDQLHPQLGEVRHRRLQRHDDGLSGRRQGPDCRDLRADLPGTVQAAGRDARRAPQPRAVSGRHLRRSVAGVRDLSHDASRRRSTSARTSGRSR